MAKPSVHHYSAREEKLNVYSHAFGFFLALCGTFLLVNKALELDSQIHLWSYLIYISTWVLLYAASTLYHNEKKEERRKRLNIMDHAAIYLSIAGTYIPVALVGIGGQWGWFIAITVGVIGLVGVIFKIFFTGRFKIASTISYVLMGSVIFIATKPLLASLSYDALVYIFVGGGFFLIGALLYSIKKIPYNHAIFHVFVLAASTCHFLGIYLYV